MCSSNHNSFGLKGVAIAWLLFSLFVSTSCTKSEDSDNSNPIVQPTDQGVYTIGVYYAHCYSRPSKNQHKLFFSLYVQSDNKIEGNITAWTIRVKKNTDLVMEINSTNFASLGFTNISNPHIFIDNLSGGRIFLTQNGWQEKDLWCNKIEMTVTVTDAYGKSTTWAAENWVDMIYYNY